MDTLYNNAIKGYIEKTQRELANYLIEESGTTIHADKFSAEAVREAIHTLNTRGFQVSNLPTGNGEQADCFVHRDLYHELLEDTDRMVRLGPSESHDPDEIGVDGMAVHAEGAMPDATGVAIHPDAVRPNPFSSASRPFLVAYPEGVVTIRVR